MPPVVLTLICIIVCGLLVIAHDAAVKDNTGVLTDEMKKGCTEIFGEGEFEMLTKKTDKGTEPVNFGDKHLKSVIVDKENKTCLLEMTCDGYAKDGLHLLNASMIHKKVVEEPMPFYQYLQKHSSHTGIRVLRIKN